MNAGGSVTYTLTVTNNGPSTVVAPSANRSGRPSPTTLDDAYEPPKAVQNARRLIEKQLIPDDVTVQVLTQARRELSQTVLDESPGRSPAEAVKHATTVAAEAMRRIHEQNPDNQDLAALYAEAAMDGETKAVRFAPVGERNETLNRAAFEGKYEVTAVSFHAYAHLADLPRVGGEWQAAGPAPIELRMRLHLVTHLLPQHPALIAILEAQPEARVLGIARSTLVEKLRKYGLSARDDADE